MTQPLCWAPFAAICSTPDGEITPCCSYTGEIDAPDLETAFNSEKMSELRDKMIKNEWPAECIKCKMREEQGGASTRHVMNKFGGSDVLDNPRIKYFDISFSNFCNIKCRMCTGSVSSKWYSDEQALEKAGLRELRYKSSSPNEITRMDFANFEIFDSAELLHFKGGEPTIDPEFKRLIEYLDSTGKIHDTDLKITTNGTVYDHELWSKIVKAKTLVVRISIESANPDMYKYMRGGNTYNIGTLTDVAHKIINIVGTGNPTDNDPQIFNSKSSKTHVVGFNVTVCAYNIFDCNSIKEWYKQFKVYTHVKTLTFAILVVNPPYLNLAVLPLEFRQRVADELYSDDPIIYKFMTQPELPGFEDLYKYTKALDKIRSENLLDIEPRFKELFDED